MLVLLWLLRLALWRRSYSSVRAAMLRHGAWGLEVGGLWGLPLRLLTHSRRFAVGATLSQTLVTDPGLVQRGVKFYSPSLPVFLAAGSGVLRGARAARSSRPNTTMEDPASVRDVTAKPHPRWPRIAPATPSHSSPCEHQGRPRTK